MHSLRPQPRKYRIGISGSYGGLNLGDEAILRAIVSQFRRSLPVEMTVFKRLPPGEAYDIPLRSLLPKGIDRLAVAGRCISGTHEAHSSYRVMPIAMATGQAAGLCAALAARAGKTPRDVPATETQRELLRQGANLKGIRR